MKRLAILAAVLCAAVALQTSAATAATRGHTSHFCNRLQTKLIGGLEYHNDAYGTSQRSCITVHDGRLTIDTSYRPVGGSVVAYDAIEFGAYPYSRDLRLGLPAQVGHRMPVLHVTASGGPGTYLYDADIWLSRGTTGALHHIREIIIANRWQGYSGYCDPYRVKVRSRFMYRFPPVRAVFVAHRLYYAGACETGGAGHAHLLIRFLAARQSAHATFPLAAFLKVALHHHWIRRAMTVDSASYAPECWSGCRGLTYSLTP